MSPLFSDRARSARGFDHSETYFRRAREAEAAAASAPPHLRAAYAESAMHWLTLAHRAREVERQQASFA